MFVLLEIIVGFILFSKNDDKSPKAKIPKVEMKDPFRKVYIATGIHIKEVPIIGRTPAKAAIRVKNKAFGTPNIKKLIPANPPCKIPTTI